MSTARQLVIKYAAQRTTVLHCSPKGVGFHPRALFMERTADVLRTRLYSPKVSGFLLAVWCCFFATAQAAEVADLFSAEVPVVTQDSGAERERAIQLALAQVLVKATGRRDVPNLPVTANILRQASRMVEQYRYRDIPKIDVPAPGAIGAGPPGEAGQAPPAFNLWVAFDPQAVQQALEEAELPIWGTTRPIMLLWLAIQDGAQRYLVDPAVHMAVKSAAETAAANRGVPMVFPLMDLEDQGRIGVSEVWGNFSDSIMAASQRYRVDGVLVGRIHRDADGQWYGRWSLYQNDGGVHWEESSRTLGQAVAAGIDVQADRLASRFAQVLSRTAQDQVRLVVYQVEDFNDYGRALKYLQSLNPVKSVLVAGVDADRVMFDLSLRGSRDGLRQVMGLGSVLAPVDPFQLRVDQAEDEGGLPGSLAAESEWAFRIVR